MAIEIKVGTGEPAPTPPTEFGVDVAVGDAAEKDKPIQVKMKIRKTLDGDILIQDHIDMDIVIIPKDFKILALAKDKMSDKVYAAQSRMFDFLKDKGVVLYDSIQGGHIYGSLEATFPEETDAGQNAIQVIMLMISKFLKKEEPYMEWDIAYDQKVEDAMLNPSDEDTTELGEVPQKAEKGSIPKSTRRSTLAFKTYV